MPIGPRRLPFFLHLAELRQRLVIILITVTVGSVILYMDRFFWPILDFVLAPISHLLPPDGLKVFTPFESFTFRFKVSMISAIVVFSPVIIWQILAFFLPALKEKERKWVVPTFLAAVILFIGGAAFAYGVVMKPAFEFMFNQGGEMITIIPGADKYLSGIMLMLVGFGLAFEIPIVVFYAVGFGLIPYAKLRENWRFVYSGLAVVAAVATPDWSPITMGLLMAALAGLYEGSLLLSRIVFAKRIKDDEDDEGEDPISLVST